MPQPMASGGVYDHHSDYQLHGAISQAELVESIAAELVPDDERSGLVLADYGCAQGRVTNLLIRRAVERVRAGYPEAPIAVLHNDLLSNDWATFLGHLRADDSYLSISGGPITPLLSAISFYEPVAPARIVDLGLSFAALSGWLRRGRRTAEQPSISTSSRERPGSRWPTRPMSTGPSFSAGAPRSWLRPADLLST